MLPVREHPAVTLLVVSVLYTATTGAEAAAADSHDHDEDIELDHILGFRV